MEHWRFWLSQLTRRLWLRAALYGGFGVAVALAAAAFSPLVPENLAKPFGGGTVDGLLNVLATSLLAVATFSVAAMLTAYTNVSQSATPRAAALITSDSQAQGALATFVGAFLYAVVAFSALGTGYYGGGGRAILFVVTLAMMALVAITLLRWLDQLLSLARLGHAVAQVEKATRAAMTSAFGVGAEASRADQAILDAQPVTAERVGYVQNVDVPRLRSLAAAHDLETWVGTPPGAFVHKGRALCHVTGVLDARTQAAIRAAFTVGESRSFDQDCRFGLIVLGEIASRALSPAVNDPGTAIVVIGTATRLLTDWAALEQSADSPAASGSGSRVHLPRPAYGDMIDDVFTPIARDGASSFAVAIRLQKALAALSDGAAVERLAILRGAAEDSLQRCHAALSHRPDAERVEAVFARLWA